MRIGANKMMAGWKAYIQTCLVTGVALGLFAFMGCTSLAPSGGFKITGQTPDGRKGVWFARTIQSGYVSTDRTMNVNYGTFTPKRAIAIGLYTESSDPSDHSALGDTGVQSWIEFNGIRLWRFKFEPILDEQRYLTESMEAATR